MHHFSFIRIAALSIVINSASYSSVSSGPFPTDTFQLLMQVLPRFHSETNAKVRNEYLVLLKTLFAQVRHGLVPNIRENVSHAAHAAEITIVNLDKGQNSTAHVRRSELLQEKNVAFIKWFDDFLINELHPSASYQRHITALKAMSFVGPTSRFKNDATSFFSRNRTDSKSHNTARKCFVGFQLIRLLFDLIIDPFDDVRSAAASLLRDLLSNVDSSNMLINPNALLQFKNDDDESAIKTAPPILHDFNKILVSTMDRAKVRMSFTGRADHADAFGRLCHLKFDFYDFIKTSTEIGDRISVLDNLLSSLSDDVIKLQNNFNFAVGSSSLHGNLVALRYFALNTSAAFAITNCEDREIISGHFFKEKVLMKNPRCHIEQLTFRILEYCSEIWGVVKQYLCVDSPEGFEMDDGEEYDSGLGPKDTLSFAWRALKESRCVTLNRTGLLSGIDSVL